MLCGSCVKPLLYARLCQDARCLRARNLSAADCPSTYTGKQRLLIRGQFQITFVHGPQGSVERKCRRLVRRTCRVTAAIQLLLAHLALYKVVFVFPAMTIQVQVPAS